MDFITYSTESTYSNYKIAINNKNKTYTTFYTNSCIKDQYGYCINVKNKKEINKIIEILKDEEYKKIGQDTFYKLR